MPDLNSLPPSRSSSTSQSASRNISNVSASNADALRAQSPSPLSRTASTSLQAAATVNAGLQQEDNQRRSSQSSTSASRTRESPTSGRRRSAVLMNIQMNNPNSPAPGEMVSETPQNFFRTSRRGSTVASPISGMGDPHHGRNPSLGEIHQELESEQEGQVNRLLQQIRQQQAELVWHRSETARLQGIAGDSEHATSAIDESVAPTSDHPRSSFSHTIPVPATGATPNPRSPSFARSSLDSTRADHNRRSRTPSRTASPRLRQGSMNTDTDPFATAGRDESAFYQAETSTMTRENQMLRQRIRELERQLAETHVNSGTSHEPSTPSNLLRSESVSENDLATSTGLPASAVSAVHADATGLTAHADPKHD